jgi:hypothetical protein
MFRITFMVRHVEKYVAITETLSPHERNCEATSHITRGAA